MRYLPLLLCLAAPLVAAQPWSDQPRNEGDIEYRRNVMRALGGHTGAMALILKGEGGQEQDLRLHANAVASLASLVPELFPPGSDLGSTHALPDIWLEPARFRQRLAELERGVDALSRSVGRGRARFAAAFQTLAGACRGCHDRYRSD